MLNNKHNEELNKFIDDNKIKHSSDFCDTKIPTHKVREKLEELYKKIEKLESTRVFCGEVK